MPNEYLPLIQKLSDKTVARKIEWKATYEPTTFICALEGEYSFQIEKSATAGGNPYRRLTMKDKDNVEVFVAFALSPTSNTTDENDELFPILVDLYEQARRIALNVDKKLHDVSNFLDTI